MKREKTHISIRDIARTMRLPPMTVSRAIRGGPVEAALKKRICAKAAAMGYRKGVFSSFKRPLKNPATVVFALQRTIGIEISNDYYFYTPVYFTAARLLTARGYQCVLTDIIDEPSLMNVSSGDIFVFSEKLPAFAVPFLSSGSLRRSALVLQGENPMGTSFKPDLDAMARMAVHYLVERGHRHVAVYSPLGNTVLGRRADAFCQACRKKDAVVDVIDADSGMKDKSAIELFAKSTKNMPTAIFTTGGFFTMQAYGFLMRNGYRIPDRIGLLGFDNFGFYEHLEVPLSRLYADLDAFGSMLAESIIASSGAPMRKKETIIVPVRFEDKGSVLPVDKMRINEVNV
ncbi:MAG: LacI family DNA-binding transcriptional regulator [Spirochaetes bacterium]|nr:LacI family DNA-binding transcriptional regulator [Spirochaetota bacterium]